MKTYAVALAAYIALMAVLSVIANHEASSIRGDCVTDYECEVIHDV